MKSYAILLQICVLLISACYRGSPKEPELKLKTEEINKSTLNENFSFTKNNFQILLKGLPEKAENNPKEFLSLSLKMLDMQPEYLLLVDKKHSLPQNLIPVEIVKLSDYPDLKTGRDDITLDRKAAEALVRLSKAAEAEGLTLRISSAYRSYEYQQALFNRYSERDGEAAASRYSARAGTSQHQLGTTVDFGSITNNFAISAEGIWMEENAGRFGWSLSYPREMEEETGYMWESWHWRWIGTDAVIMQKNFFDGVQQRMLVFWNENATEMRKALMKDID